MFLFGACIDVQPGIYFGTKKRRCELFHYYIVNINRVLSHTLSHNHQLSPQKRGNAVYLTHTGSTGIALPTKSSEQ